MQQPPLGEKGGCVNFVNSRSLQARRRRRAFFEQVFNHV